MSIIKSSRRQKKVRMETSIRGMIHSITPDMDTGFLVTFKKLRSSLWIEKGQWRRSPALVLTSCGVGLARLDSSMSAVLFSSSHMVSVLSSRGGL